MSTVTGDSLPEVTRQESSVESALHAGDQDQETGGHMSKNGKSREQSCRLPGRDGSNYPGSPLGVSHVSPLCTRPVTINSSRTTRSDRLICINSRNRPPVKMHVRSGKEEPSLQIVVKLNPGHAPVGELSAPPSADRPKLLSTPPQVKSARGVVRKRARKYNRGWCYPGRGTPSAPRTGRIPPVRVGGMSIKIKKF